MIVDTITVDSYLCCVAFQDPNLNWLKEVMYSLSRILQR